MQRNSIEGRQDQLFPGIPLTTSLETLDFTLSEAIISPIEVFGGTLGAT